MITQLGESATAAARALRRLGRALQGARRRRPDRPSAGGPAPARDDRARDAAGRPAPQRRPVVHVRVHAPAAARGARRPGRAGAAVHDPARGRLPPGRLLARARTRPSSELGMATNAKLTLQFARKTWRLDGYDGYIETDRIPGDTWDTTVNQRGREGILVVYTRRARGARPTRPPSAHGPAPPARRPRDRRHGWRAIYPHLDARFHRPGAPRRLGAQPVVARLLRRVPRRPVHPLPRARRARAARAACTSPASTPTPTSRATSTAPCEAASASRVSSSPRPRPARPEPSPAAHPVQAAAAGRGP